MSAEKIQEIHYAYQHSLNPHLWAYVATRALGITMEWSMHYGYPFNTYIDVLVRQRPVDTEASEPRLATLASLLTEEVANTLVNLSEEDFETRLEEILGEV